MTSLLLSLTNLLAQSKKEQIEQLVLRIDSCNTVISSHNKIIEQMTLEIANLKRSEARLNESLNFIDKQLKKSEELNSKLLTENNQAKKEIELLKTKIPVEAYFDFNILSEAEDQDARFGNESQTEVLLIIEKRLVDTFYDFGIPEIDPDKLRISLSSDVSERNYEITTRDHNKLTVKLSVYCSDCETQELVSEKTYVRTGDGNWKFSYCTGDCGN